MKIECPFKYKWWKGMEEPVDIIACKLMSPPNECVGEKACPILKRS